MATYNLTPSERRARAQALKEQRENRYLYSNFLAQKQEAEKQAEQERLNAIFNKNEKESQNFFVRGVSTIGDIAANVITGAVKGLEGIYDLGASLVGAVGGIFDEDFQNRVKSHVAYDWTSETIGNPLQELTKYSYTKDGGIIEGVASGIGQMLPAVAVSIATAGIGAAASGASLAASMGSTAAQAASLATLGISAAGNSTEEAFNDGAGYYQGLGYGLVSGGVEVATEKMTGGFGKLTGKGVFDNVLPSVGKKGIGKVVKEAIGEGFEEVVSEAVNPLTKAIYKGKVENFMTADHFKEMAKAGTIGALTSMAYGETVGRALHTTGKEGDIKDALAEYSTLKTKTQNLDKVGKIDDVTKNGKTNRENIYTNKVGELKIIEDTLKGISEEKRAKIIKRNSLESMFEADGSIKADFAVKEGLSSIIEQVDGQEQSEVNKALASQPMKYRTAFSNDTATAKALEKTGATPFVGEMTSEQAEDYSIFRKMIGTLSQKSNGSIKYVVADSFKANAAIDSDSGTIVIGVDQFGKSTSGIEIAKALITSDMWQKSAIHETKHSTEGTKSGYDLNLHLASDGETYNTARESFVTRGYFGEDYQKAIEKMTSLENKAKNGEQLTEQETKNLDTYRSELPAIMAENVLGNESFINKLVRGDTNIAERMVNIISDIKEAFASMKSKETRVDYKYLVKAENLYLKAIEESGGKYVKGKIIGINDKDDKPEVAKESKKQYNRTDNYLWEKLSKQEQAMLYERIDHMHHLNYTETKLPNGKYLIDIQNKVVITNGSYSSPTVEGVVEFNRFSEKISKARDYFYEQTTNGRTVREGVEFVNAMCEEEVATFYGYDNSIQNSRKEQQEQGVGRYTTDNERNGERSGSLGKDKGVVKFSLKIGNEQLNINGEVTDKLVALHNLSEEKLLKVIELGGFPMPSIAVTKPTIPHNEFGGITVVFGKDTIDPQNDSRNKVFSRDAWTPTVPKIEYKVNEKIADKIHKKYYELYRKFGKDTLDPLYKYANDIEDTLNREGGESEILKNLYSNKYVKQIYLLDSGKERIANKHKTIKIEKPKLQVEKDKLLISALGKNVVLDIQAPIDSEMSKIFEHRRNYIKKYGETIRETLKIDNASDRDLLTAVLSAKKYLEDNGVEYREEIDTEATQKAIDKSVNQSEYESWVDSLFKGIEEKTGVRNNTDLFTYNGNRRSFESLHYTYTLDNIIKVMLEDTQKGGSGWIGITPNVLGAKLSREFYSIKELKENAKSLVVFNDTMKTDFAEVAGTMLNEISEGMVDESRYSNNLEIWQAMDGTASIVGEIADKKLFTLPAINAFMAREYKGTAYKYSESIGKKILALFDYIKQLNQTDYFEAKPRRAVGLSEIKQVLIPNNTSKEFISKLEKEDIPYTTYDNGDENARTDIIKSMENIQFSRKDSQGNTLTQEQIDFFKDSKVRDENGNLLVVYHGTKNGDFSIFEYSANKQTGTDYGEAYYFTSDKEKAGGYAYNVDEDVKIKEYEANRKKLLQKFVDTKSTKDKEAFLNYKLDGKNIVELINGGDYNATGGEIKSVYLNIQNPYEVDAKGKYFYEVYEEYFNKARENVNDGLIIKNVIDNPRGEPRPIDVYIAFSPNQIKLITNENPTQNVDIRYSLKKNEPIYKLTKGQLKKIIANNTRYKVYTKADSEAIINNVLSNYMAFGAKYGDLSGKSKQEAIDMLWKGLNSANPGYQMGVALHIADYIIQNGVLENIYGDEDTQWAVDTIDMLKPYLHSLDLDSIKGEIKYKYDTDKSPYLLWGKRRSLKGVAPDVLGKELEEVMQIDAINEADIFFQVDELYRSAVSALKKKAKTFLSEGLSDTERKDLRQEIAKEVLRGFDYAGGDSKLANIVNKYTDRIRVLKEQLQDEKVRNSVINRLLDKTQKLKDLKLGTFLNATEFKSDIFKGSIEKLASIKFRGDLNQSGTRKIVAGLAEWYVETNEIVGEAYEKEIGEALVEIANGKGKLTTQELRNLTNIVDYFKHFVETYNKVLRNGQYVEAQPIAEGYIQTLRDNKAIKVGWFNKVSGSSYVKIFGDPMSVARRMDMYESGFYTEMLERLRESTVNAAVDEMDIRAELDEFLTKNKKYLKEASKRKVKYLGNDIPLMEALYVYMALGRKQAQLGLEKSGFTFKQDKDTIRVNGFDSEGKTAEIAQSDIFKQLNETDKQFIEIAKKIFNEECKERKRKTDIARRGYSNVSEDEYIPIRRANVAKSVDSSTFKEEMDRVSNASFNKDTVQGAMQELSVEPLNEVLDRHIHAVAQYTNLATTIDEYNKLFSLDISGNKNKPVSVATESQNSWKDGDEYFKKLISDIQGIPTSKGVGNRAMSYVRGNYAKYQLGFNPKVWLTQLSSFAAAGSILDVKSIIKGLGISSKDIDEYSALAKLRNKDNTAAMAQGVLSKPNKVNLTALNDFSDLLMKPIGVVDRFVVKKLFGACQVQVEKENSLKIGTAENKQKAAELLNKVILETQQNFMATERSAAMRSGSEFMKTITMFSADAMKVVGRVIDSIGELTTLQARKKVATDPARRAELEKRIKAAQKKTAKSVASLVTSAVLMALIAQLFRTLYNKDDEEDNIAQNMAIDAIGNLLGGLPIIRDIYSRFTQGYEISGYAYSALNDLLDTGVGIFETVGDIFSGKTDSKDIALNIKKLTYAGGQLLGLPTRNVYNIAYGLTKRFSPSAAYKIDDLFYNQSYSSDLAKAIENGDDSMIATITGIMLNENVGGIEETSVREEMNSLVSKGYSVLPRSIGDKITYEGEEITLTNKQKEQFKTVYSEANSKVASLLNLSQYKFATEEVRAKAIKYIYDIYYNLALEDLLGVDLENKNLLFVEAIEIEKLAIIVASARELSADTDKNGRTVSGSKKAKVQAYVNALQLSAVQKYMIMGYLGYSNENGKNQVKGYIQRLSLSKTQKQQLFEYSGYAA